MNILPRQARDKHRESTQQKPVLLQSRQWLTIPHPYRASFVRPTARYAHMQVLVLVLGFIHVHVHVQSTAWLDCWTCWTCWLQGRLIVKIAPMALRIGLGRLADTWVPHRDPPPAHRVSPNFREMREACYITETYRGPIRLRVLEPRAQPDCVCCCGGRSAWALGWRRSRCVVY